MRLEAVESFYVLCHLTVDPIYREWGCWEVFQAIERYCKTKAGYSQLKNDEKPDQKPEDRMESFILAETLKYPLSTEAGTFVVTEVDLQCCCCHRRKPTLPRTELIENTCPT